MNRQDKINKVMRKFKDDKLYVRRIGYDQKINQTLHSVHLYFSVSFEWSVYSSWRRQYSTDLHHGKFNSKFGIVILKNKVF